MSCPPVQHAIDAYLKANDPGLLRPHWGHLSECDACRKRIVALIYTEMAIGERTPALTPEIQNLIKRSETQVPLIGLSQLPRAPKRRLQPLWWLLGGLAGTLFIGWTLSLLGVI